MEYCKFILSGEDRNLLKVMKNTIVSSGHIYLGYSKEPYGLLRHIRCFSPDFLVIEVCKNFRDLRHVLEVIDEELLAACILVLDNKDDEISEFLRNSRVMTYITKPVLDETLLQVLDITLIGYKRVLEYEEKVRMLSDTIESRKVMERAKWILVEKEGYSESQAYDAIRKKSRDNRIPMREIAEAIVMTRG